MTLTIRKALESDAPSLSRICLLTADAGESAEALHDYGELPGLVYAVPYVKLPTTWGFVLVDRDDTNAPVDESEQLGNENEKVVGYILGSFDTRAFEKHAADIWWPALAEKYPPSFARKPADERYMKLLRDMHTAPDDNIAFAPAHLHIDILPEYQKKGWGRRLIEEAIEHLRTEVGGVWLGLDPRNEGAKTFYRKLGFEDIDGAPEGNMGLKFESGC